MLINDLNIHTINPATGEIIRQLTLDAHPQLPTTDTRTQENPQTVGSEVSYVARHDSNCRLQPVLVTRVIGECDAELWPEPAAPICA
jgi:hypothetical protein